VTDITHISLGDDNFSLPEEYWSTNIVRMENEQHKARRRSRVEIEFLPKWNRNTFCLLREIPNVCVRQISAEEYTLLASSAKFDGVVSEFGIEVSGQVERDEKGRALRFIPTNDFAPSSFFVFAVGEREPCSAGMKIVCPFMSGEE